MHLIERYALSTGSKIGKPYIVKKFFPVGCEKYITIQNSSGMTAKCYDYFEDVVLFLRNKLQENGYQIVQIGSAEDNPITGAIHLQGKTNINQTAYILSNSSLHLGNDSFAIHMCSAFNIKCIGLYGITTPSIAGPYWNKENCITLEPENFIPSFDPNENPKQVNKIRIEQVVKSVNKLLFNQNDIDITSIFIGDRYSDIVIETMPDQIISPEFFSNHMLNIRMDYMPEFDSINHLLSSISLRKCSIVTDRPINNIEQLIHKKENITCIIYNVSKNLNVEFIEKLHSNGFNYICVAEEDSDIDIENIKYKIMEYCHLETITKKPQNMPEIDFTCENLFYRTNRILLASQKIYSGKEAYLSNSPMNDIGNFYRKLSEISDIETFMNNDINHCLIFSKN